MASSYSRKFTSSASNRANSSSQKGSGGTSRSARSSSPAARPTQRRSSSQKNTYTAIPGGRISDRRHQRVRVPLTSVRVGDIGRAQRVERLRRKDRRAGLIFGSIVILILALFTAGVALYNSDVFSIESVSVVGVDHLTESDLQDLAGVSEGTTLLNVDLAGIEESLLSNAWIEDVAINRVFPNTLEIVVTERTIAAVVEVPTENAESVVNWAISLDGMWLMAIPDADSEEGQLTSDQVYEDIESVPVITDVPYGTSAEVGEYCADDSVNNALSIVTGLTTELADRVVAVKADETESTTVTIQNGPDIVFGTAEYLREKELVCLEIMEMYPDGVSYINVRDVENPIWRTA